MNIDLISVVIPVFNSERVVGTTVREVCDFFDSQGQRFELILVNDGSRDGSWEILESLAKSRPEIVAIDLFKNYGQHTANFCGFSHARGEYVVTMDDDGQNPPAEISKLVKKASEGFDLVLGEFPNKQHSIYRIVGSKLVGFLIRRVFGGETKLTLSNFRIIHNSVIEKVLNHRKFQPFVPGLLLRYSKAQANVATLHRKRKVGHSNYTLRKIMSLIFSILFSYSTIPLRCASAIGILSAVCGLILMICIFSGYLLQGQSVPGWTSISLLIVVFGSLNIAILSIIGEYQIRILRDVEAEVFSVRKVINNG